MKIYDRIILKISILLVLILLINNCSYKNSKENIIGLDIEEKGTIKIIDSRNNKYLGYIYLGNKNENPPEESWIMNAYVYEKYVINQKCYGNHPVGISVYKKNKKIDIFEYKEQNEIFISYEHYLLGIYDNYLFLLSMGNPTTYRNFTNRNFIILDLNNNKIIYKGVFIWNIGIKFREPYIIETYELINQIDNCNKFIFEKYLFNLRTKEKININNRI